MRGAALASTLTSVTTTNASTLHVKGAPSAGNNMTLTNANALRVSGGNTLLEGDINVSGSSVFGGDVTFNGQMTTNSGMTINGSATGGSDSTLADIKFTSGKIETINAAGLTAMNPVNVAGNIFVESDNPELLMKASSASDGTPRIKLVSDNSGEKGDSLEIKTLNGVTTISSDHNSTGVFDAEILKLTGNGTSSDVAVETVGQLRADSIKLADGKKMIFGNNSEMNLFFDGTNANIKSSGAINIGTQDENSIINLGHATSEVTIGDNLTVNGDTSIVGDLTVSGKVVTTHATSLTVADKIIKLGEGNIGSTQDLGIVFTRGDGITTIH